MYQKIHPPAFSVSEYYLLKVELQLIFDAFFYSYVYLQSSAPQIPQKEDILAYNMSRYYNLQCGQDRVGLAHLRECLNCSISDEVVLHVQSG